MGTEQLKNTLPKPFVKWAGGKSNLIQEIDKLVPDSFKNKPFTYIEPFVGGGAFLFHILNNYPNVKKIVINDINSDLINAYKVIQNNVNELISILEKWKTEYHLLENSPENKKEYYYQKLKAKILSLISKQNLTLF